MSPNALSPGARRHQWNGFGNDLLNTCFEVILEAARGRGSPGRFLQAKIGEGKSPVQ